MSQRNFQLTIKNLKQGNHIGYLEWRKISGIANDNSNAENANNQLVFRLSWISVWLVLRILGVF